jgi:site-specific DNA recombinase
MKIAYAYCRISTNEIKQRNSIAVQKAVIESFALANGYDVVKYYIEQRTGADDDRPIFNQVLKRCINENAFLITWKIDRLSRSLSIFNRIQDHLHLIRFTELQDTEPNLLILSLLLGVAHQERINIGVRVSATYKMLKAKDPNHPWGNPNFKSEVMPLGKITRLQNASDFNRRIQSLCNDLRKAGYCTLKSLALKLNEIGLKTRRGSNFNQNNLHRILKYRGA